MSDSLDRPSIEPKKQSHAVEISTKTILKIVFIGLLLYFIYAIRSVVGILFVSFVLAAAIDPWVDKMSRMKVPRGLSVIFLYIVGLGIFSLAIYLLVPPIATEIQQLSQNFPTYYKQFISSFSQAQQVGEQYGVSSSVQGWIDSLKGNINTFTKGIFSTLTTIFGGVVSLFGVLVITFYMTVEEDGMKKFLRAIAPVKYQPYVIHKIHQIQRKLGHWLQGQLVLSLIIGVFTYIGLRIVGVEYALVLAFVAGVTEFIPYVGPFLGAIPGVFLAFTQSPFKAVLAIIVYLVIQQLENQVIVPKVMQRSVGLNPIVVLVVMLIGANVGGLVGIILAVPAATIVWVFLVDFFEEKKMRDNELEEGGLTETKV